MQDRSEWIEDAFNTLVEQQEKLASDQELFKAVIKQLAEEKQEVTGLRETLKIPVQEEQDRTWARANKALDEARANLKAAIFRSRKEQGLPDKAEDDQTAVAQTPGSIAENTQAEADSINARTDRATAQKQKGSEPGTAIATASSSSGPARTKTIKKKIKARKTKRTIQKQGPQDDSEDDSSSSGPSIAY